MNMPYMSCTLETFQFDKSPWNEPIAGPWNIMRIVVALPVFHWEMSPLKGQFSNICDMSTTLRVSQRETSPSNAESLNNAFISVTLDTLMKFKSTLSPCVAIAASTNSLR